MKRDMDLVREILLTLEESPSPWYGSELEIEGYEKNQVHFHVGLCYEAGLIDAIKIGAQQSPERWLPKRLTWNGYEFLEAARSEERWSKAKEAAGQVGGFTLDTMKAVLIALATQTAKQTLGLP